MKKNCSLILALVLALSVMLTACGNLAEGSTPNTEAPAETTAPAVSTPAETSAPSETTGTPTQPEKTIPYPPADETFATKTFTKETKDILLTVTVRGRQSESLGKEFYLRDDRMTRVTVTVKNLSSKPIRQFLSTYCRNSSIPTTSPARHNHEIGFSFTDGQGNPLNHIVGAEGCPAQIDTWELGVGASETFYFNLSPRTVDSLTSIPMGISLDEIFTKYTTPLEDSAFTDEGTCLSDTFTGQFSFAYLKENETSPNSLSCTLDLSLEVLRFGKNPAVSEADYPEDMTPAEKTFSVEKDGILLTVTAEGYKSENLGKDFFLLYNAPISLRVTVENKGSRDITQWLGSFCHGDDTRDHTWLYYHNHEVTCSLTDANGNELNRLFPYLVCPTAIQKWTLPQGETETFYFHLAAGEMDPAFLWDGAMTENPTAEELFREYAMLYPETAYTEEGTYLSDTFSGEFSFSCMEEDADDDEWRNNLKVTLPVSLEVIRPKPAK